MVAAGGPRQRRRSHSSSIACVKRMWRPGRRHGSHPVLAASWIQLVLTDSSAVGLVGLLRRSLERPHGTAACPWRSRDRL